MGLHQGRRLEHFVERAEAAGEEDQGLGTLQKVHLADREIVEAETQFRRHIGIGRLLTRQDNVQPDRFGADIGGAAIGRLHDARPAAGQDDEIAFGVDLADRRNQTREASRLIVVPGIGQQPACLADGAIPLGIARIGPRRGFCLGDATQSEFGLRYPGAAEHRDGRANALFLKQQFGLEQFQLKAHRPQIVAQQEILVGEGQEERGRPRLRRVRDAVGTLDILARGGERVEFLGAHWRPLLDLHRG